MRKHIRKSHESRRQSLAVPQEVYGYGEARRHSDSGHLLGMAVTLRRSSFPINRATTYRRKSADVLQDTSRKLDERINASDVNSYKLIIIISVFFVFLLATIALSIYNNLVKWNTEVADFLDAVSYYAFGGWRLYFVRMNNQWNNGAQDMFVWYKMDFKSSQPELLHT